MFPVHWTRSLFDEKHKSDGPNNNVIFLDRIGLIVSRRHTTNETSVSGRCKLFFMLHR